MLTCPDEVLTTKNFRCHDRSTVENRSCRHTLQNGLHAAEYLSGQSKNDDDEQPCQASYHGDPQKTWVCFAKAWKENGKQYCDYHRIENDKDGVH